MHPTTLIGTWRFERSVRDRSAGTDYEATGTAEFALLRDGRIRWSEHGVLGWNGRTTPVERTLYLVPAVTTAHPLATADAAWLVTFDDGRAFHPWAAGAVSHWCDPDQYDALITSRGGATDAWSIAWTAAGPHKDYQMTTDYRRVAAST